MAVSTPSKVRLQRDAFNGVADALYAHFGSAEPITVDLMRRTLGVGSDSTHNQWLREWKAALARGEAALPAMLNQKVMASTKAIYATARELAQAELVAARCDWEAERAELKKAVDEALTTRDEATEALTHVRAELECLRGERDAGAQRIARLEREMERIDAQREHAQSEVERIGKQVVRERTQAECALKAVQDEAEHSRREMTEYLDASRQEIARLSALLTQAYARATDAEKRAQARIQRLEHDLERARADQASRVEQLGSELARLRTAAQEAASAAAQDIRAAIAERDAARDEVAEISRRRDCERDRYDALFASMNDDLSTLRKMLQQRQKRRKEVVAKSSKKIIHGPV